MMRWNPSLRDRRALTVGAVVVGALMTFNFAVRPTLGGYRGLRDAIDEERMLLTRELELLETLPSLAEGVDAGGERLLAAVPRMFDGDTDGVAAAYLAEYIHDTARASRALITRLDPGGSEAVGPGLESLAAVVHGESDLEGLLTLLYRLEAGEKLVQVSDLNIRAARGGTGPQTQMEVISFDMKVTGFQLLSFDRTAGTSGPSDAGEGDA